MHLDQITPVTDPAMTPLKIPLRADECRSCSCVQMLRVFLMTVVCSEEAMRKAGTAHNKSSTDMENHVFIKAKSRVSAGERSTNVLWQNVTNFLMNPSFQDEYLSLVARLIIHFRDIREYFVTLKSSSCCRGRCQ